MNFSIRRIYPALIIIFAWVFWFSFEADLICQGKSNMSWYTYRCFILMAIVSSLVSGMLVYISEDKGRMIWLSAGVLAPFLINFLFDALGWYLNFEIVLRELTDDFDICGFAMIFTIPLSVYMKCRLEDEKKHS